MKHTVGFDPARSRFDLVVGDHVIMQAGAFAVFAHVAPGAVPVTTGQEVRVGE